MSELLGRIKVAVLADTHIPKRARSLPDAADALVRSSQAILHAGDVLTDDFLNYLRQFAPVFAVRGNNDLHLDLPERLEFVLSGVKIAMIHDTGPKLGREKRMQKLFPHADVVVFGHSHIPWNSTSGTQLLFNPGSATDRRREPHHTIGELILQDGRISSATIIALD